MNAAFLQRVLLSIIVWIPISCKEKNVGLTKEIINEMNLKRGAIISCGPSDMQLGSVDFEISCSGKVKDDFNLAAKLLHSFEYDEAEKVFAKIIDEQQECVMAY